MIEDVEAFIKMSEDEREEYINEGIENNTINSNRKRIMARYRKYCKNRYFGVNVKKRDKFCCRVCGCENNLEVHHIQSVAGLMDYHKIRVFEQLFLFPIFWDEFNMITLCANCHRQVHDDSNGRPEYAFEWVKISCEVLIQINGNRATQTEIINKMLTDQLDWEYQKSTSWVNRLKIWIGNLI